MSRTLFNRFIVALSLLSTGCGPLVCEAGSYLADKECLPCSEPAEGEYVSATCSDEADTTIAAC